MLIPAMQAGRYNKCWLTHLFTHSPTHSLIHPLTHSPTHSFNARRREGALVSSGGCHRLLHPTSLTRHSLAFKQRQDEKPFFLIDFSDILQVSVFSLGAVFLQLTKLLRLENQPQLTKPVDPSLYIHRFADKMGYADDILNAVSSTAMRLVASMKRDWIQTGRRPSGVCGAALYIASHLHGKPRTKREIVNVVHIGEFTLSKRLNEFATTPAGGMNKQEFLQHSEMLERTERMAIDRAEGVALPEGKIGGCCHVQQDRESHFRQGLCRDCFLTFVGCTGVYEGANPPAFSKNREKENRELLALEAKAKEGTDQEEGAKEGRGGVAVKSIKGATSHKSDASDADSDREDIGDEEEDVRGICEGSDAPNPTIPERPVTRRSGRVAKLEEHERQRNSSAHATPSNAKSSSTISKGRAGSGATTVGKGKGKNPSGEDVEDEPPFPDPKDVMDRNNINIAFVEAAENVVESFEEDLAKVQEADAKKQRKRMPSTAALISKLSKHAEQEAAVAIGEDRDMIVAGRGESLPLSVAGDFAGGYEELMEDPYELMDETLSDISDSEIDQYIAEEGEVKYKEEIWNMMNQDWMEKQEAKKAAQEAQLRAQEEQRLAMERAAAAGVAYKRGRGRPLGSKSRPKTNDTLPLAETPEEAAMRVMDDKKLSAKINYQVLQQLFERDGPSSNLPLLDDGGAGGQNVGAMGNLGAITSGPGGGPSVASTAIEIAIGTSGDTLAMPSSKRSKKVAATSLAMQGQPAIPPPKFSAAASRPRGARAVVTNPNRGTSSSTTGMASAQHAQTGPCGPSSLGLVNNESRGTAGPSGQSVTARIGGLGTLSGSGRAGMLGPLGPAPGPIDPSRPPRLGGLTKPKGVIAPRSSK